VEQSSEFRENDLIMVANSFLDYLNEQIDEFMVDYE
jgi:hypothetical protein